MATFNALGQLTPNHKPWDRVGSITPDIEHSEGERPSLSGLKPAPYLPVQFFDKHFDNWMTIMAGKLVTLDPFGFVIPAQYGLTSATLTYTANDVTAGTIDIRTGAAVTSAGSVTLSQVDGSTYGLLGKEGYSFFDSTRKYPVGVTPYPILQWAGDGGTWDDGWNPAGYKYHNYNMQHQIAILCDWCIRLPYIPAQSSAETISHAWNNAAITFGTANGWRNRTYIQATARYDTSTGVYPVLSTYNVAALPLNYYPVAKNTATTTISSTLTTLLVNEVASVDKIIAAGDYWIDYDMGVLFVYSSGGSTLPVTAGYTITYYHYNASPAVVSAFGSVVASSTTLQPGDFLKCDSNSNFVRLNPSVDTFFDAVGQVLQIDTTHPRDYLEYVRTAYSPAISTSAWGTMANAIAGSASANLGALDKATGSATGGIPTRITYAGGSNAEVIVNLIGR